MTYIQKKTLQHIQVVILRSFLFQAVERRLRLYAR